MEKIIICNLKSNLLNNDINNYINKIKNNNFIILPSNIYIKDFIKENINVGIQDISPYENGSYTSFISANQASSVGVKYILLNHVEIKKMTNQTITDLKNKIKLSQKYNLKIILCIENIIELKEIIKDIDLKDIIFVLEPGYTIGNVALTINEIKENIINIKKIIKENKVLYGGSVNKSNIKNILSITEVDGVLLGKASLDIENIIKEVN